MAITGDPASLEREREWTVDLLATRFAEDLLSMEEYERRVASAENATDSPALAGLVHDLAPPARHDDTTSTALAQRPSHIGAVRIVEDTALVETGQVRAILGEISRKGSWRVPRLLQVRAVLGSVEIDFRSAEMGPGVTTVQTHALLGEVIIIVPPGIRVQLEGNGILGEFSGHLDTDENLSPHAPCLRITGQCVLGEVSVQTRRAGESKRDAKRRRKLERKQRKQLEKLER